ncbi:MAG: hypothetical protein LUI09_05865 [Prevotellaceae bacterium]|nr:hypothetical protein [Prevotellaceae bacterium]
MNKKNLFKHMLLTLTIVAIALATPGKALAQTELQGQADSVATAMRLQNLRATREALKKQIDAEDKKREQIIEGVSAETMEEMNLKQDSVCLSLRSHLVSVELEIKEIGGRAASVSDLINSYRQQNGAEATKEEEKQ